MDIDDVWVVPTEKRGRKEKEIKFPTFQQSMQPVSSNGLPSLKKIQLLPVADELSTASLPIPEIIPTSSAPMIKPPPTIFMDLWGESENTSSSTTEVLQTSILNLDQNREEHQDVFVLENTLDVPEGKSSHAILLQEESMLDGLQENVLEKTSEDWAEQDATSFNDFDLFEDLDLFDVDAVLAKQEAEIQQQEYEREREITHKGSRAERWGGISSLIHVNWDNPETAEQDALTRLGYANISLSKETRAFIIQAARNARLPHRQEIQLTTQLANARTQLNSLPPFNEEEDVTDSYASTRLALQIEIREIEQTLTNKMQWVAIKKAVQFLGRGVELDDLIQFGMEGVIAGIQHFDITRKARLLFAVHTWTFQALSRAIADYGSAIRLPAHLFEQVHTLKKHHFQWQQEHGRLPTRQELAKSMDISLKDLLTILKAIEIVQSSKESLSIEHLIRTEYLDEGDSSQELQGSLFANDDILIDVLEDITGQQMQELLYHSLTPKEQQVFSLRVGLNEDVKEHTLEEIGKCLQVTRERVRQIEERARKKMASLVREMYPELFTFQNAEGVNSDGENIHQKKRKARKNGASK